MVLLLLLLMYKGSNCTVKKKNCSASKMVLGIQLTAQTFATANDNSMITSFITNMNAPTIQNKDCAKEDRKDAGHQMTEDEISG